MEDWHGRQYLRTTDIIGLYSTTVTYMASKAIEFGEKRKIRAITPFEVIKGHRGRYQSNNNNNNNNLRLFATPKARMQLLLVINSN